MEHPRSRGISHIRVTAVLSVIALLGAGIFQAFNITHQTARPAAFIASTANSATASDTASGLLGAAVDPVAEISSNAIGQIVGAYAGLQQHGIYSSTTGAQIAGQIGMGLQTPITYAPITQSSVRTTPDTSYQSMMNYRAALQKSLKPLLNNKTPEYTLFGLYVQTKQQTYLDQLRTAEDNYRAAASSTATLTVPSDAVAVELGLVNSMNEFSATLDALITHADDPIASTVLLENYNAAESDVLNAFQALTVYEKSKIQ